MENSKLENGISLAVGKAWAKQKLQGEEIMMLLERRVPVWELLERVTGKNVQELQKLSSAGKLGSDVMRKLIAEIGRSSEGAAAHDSFIAMQQGVGTVNTSEAKGSMH